MVTNLKIIILYWRRNRRPFSRETKELKCHHSALSSWHRTGSTMPSITTTIRGCHHIGRGSCLTPRTSSTTVDWIASSITSGRRDNRTRTSGLMWASPTQLSTPIKIPTSSNTKARRRRRQMEEQRSWSKICNKLLIRLYLTQDKWQIRPRWGSRSKATTIRPWIRRGVSVRRRATPIPPKFLSLSIWNGSTPRGWEAHRRRWILPIIIQLGRMSKTRRPNRKEIYPKTTRGMSVSSEEQSSQPNLLIHIFISRVRRSSRGCQGRSWILDYIIQISKLLN